MNDDDHSLCNGVSPIRIVSERPNFPSLIQEKKSAEMLLVPIEQVEIREAAKSEDLPRKINATMIGFGNCHANLFDARKKVRLPAKE